MPGRKLRFATRRRRDRGSRPYTSTQPSSVWRLYEARVRRRRRARTTRRYVYDRPHRLEEDASQYLDTWQHVPIIIPKYKVSGLDSSSVYTLQPSLKGIRLHDLRTALWKSSCEYKCWHPVVQILASKPRTHLSRHLEMVLDDYALTTAPSHYIALYPTASVGPYRSPNERDKISIIPVHAFILALFCSKIRSYPSSARIVTPGGWHQASSTHASPPTDTQYHTLRLPVLPIPLPDPSSFMTLLQYFYTGSLPSFCVNAAPYLLNLPAGFARGQGDDKSASYMRYLSHALAESYTRPLLRCFWKRLWWMSWNLVALGVSDQRLWDVLHTQTACLSRAVALQSDERGLPPAMKSRVRGERTHDLKSPFVLAVPA